MTIEPRPLTAKRRAEIERAIVAARAIPPGFADTYSGWAAGMELAEKLLAALTHAEQRIAELEAGLRDIGSKPILREANPYAEIENLQLKAWSVLEATP